MTGRGRRVPRLPGGAQSPLLAGSRHLETGEARFFPVTPAPAPRQVRSDTWNPRPGVKRYRAFRDEVARRRVWVPTPGDLIVFLMPIPRSWSQRKRESFDGMPHEPKPDADNLLKALLDACLGEDSHLWTNVPAKVWSATPGIYIERREPALAVPFHVPAGLS